MIPAYFHAMLSTRIETADRRYGPFTSTHEALGVALEEWDELRDAIQHNDQPAIAEECADLAAVLIRLARLMRDHDYQHKRSTKADGTG